MRMKRTGFASIALAAAVSSAWCTSAFAQAAPAEATPGQPQARQPQAVVPDSAPKVHGVVGATYTSDYITRGVLLENQGAIVQPFAELDFTLAEHPDAPNFGKVVGIVGVWSSLHSHHEFAGSVGGQDPTTLDAWYEFDWYAGLGIDITPELNLNLIYQEFLSPSDAFGTCKNFQAKFTYNDSKMWEGKGPWSGFGLNPYALVFVELDGKAGTGSDEGVYVEVGIGPSYTFSPESYMPLTLTVPITAGFGFSDFYGSGTEDGSFTGSDEENFGFVSVGLTASMPLKFMEDAGFGAWKYSVGGYYYYLGDGVHDFNQSFAGANSRSEWVFTTGFSVSF